MTDRSTDRTRRLGNSPFRVGRFTYGVRNLTARQFGEGAALTIGRFCSLADGITVFLGGDHRVDWITTFPFGTAMREHFPGPDSGHPVSRGDVVIGNDVWIGSQSTIMAGVTIGDGAVIAAHAVVVRDVAPYEIVGGNPAKSLKQRFDAPTVAALQRLRWWDLPEAVLAGISTRLCAPPTPDLLQALIDETAGQHDAPLEPVAGLGQTRPLP